MVAERTLSEVLHDMGSGRILFEDTLGQLQRYGLRVNVTYDAKNEIDYTSHRVSPFTGFATESTLLCRMLVQNGDGFGGHLVVIHRGVLFDPSLDKEYQLLDGMRRWQECAPLVLFNSVFEVVLPE
jgi:hypothetical protein